MRIIAKNHDYYDCIQGQAQDRTLLYLRTESEEDAGNGFPDYKFGSRTKTLTSTLIGFCGKFYAAFRYDVEIPNKGKKDRHDKNAGLYEIKTEWIYDRDVVRRIYKEMKEERKRRSGYYYTHGIEWFFDNFDRFSNRYQGRLFSGQPIFVVEKIGYESTLYRNCELKGYDFFKVFDPYTAFQEISMWLGNQAHPEPKMIETSNETRLEAHGFDRKTSFRKEPSNKRSKR